MTFRLTVDGQHWTQQLAATGASWPGLVPVIKGNGYGFGNARLAQRAAAIGSDSVAVGTAAEVDVVRASFAGSILVMAPLTPSEVSEVSGVTGATGATGLTGATGVTGRRGVIRAVASAAVVESLAAQGASDPVVLEIDSAVHRHGIPVSSIGALAPAIERLPLAGLALHLPAGGDRRHLIQETARTVLDVRTAGIEPRLLWLSHVSRAEMLALQQQLPWMQLRIRMGTGLWLGDRSAFTASGAVLDLHRVPRRQLIGYRQRRCPAGTIVVVSGGTAHGVGLHAGAAQGSWRALVRAAVAGAAHGAGLTSSPFYWQGRRLRYADVPHMQVSMLLVPADVTPPAVGDRLECDVRMTVSTFDEVDLIDPPAAPAAQAA